MVRPKIERRIVKKPDYTCLRHGDVLENDQDTIKMNLDEFEAIRLGDYHNIKQKEAAELMGISQPTFHRIINSARKKTAMSLIEGKKIEINNENFQAEEKIYICKDCGFQWNNPKKDPERGRHYNHSSFIDLVMTGICGIRPALDGTLTVRPLGTSLSGFEVSDVPYHGRLLDVEWDEKLGLKLVVDQKKEYRCAASDARITVEL
jgi:predicted DNA-binding protein (UPF0251 family)